MNAASQTDVGPTLSGRRIHVLEVIGNAIVGGMESWVERMIERLPPSRFLVTALCPFESPYTERLRTLGVEVLVAPMPEDPPWATLQMASSFVDACGVDLLHAHLPNAHLLAGLAGRLTGKPVLCTVHGRQLTTLDLEVHRAVGSHLSVVCKQSYYHALGLGVKAENLSCETNGVDTAVFQPRQGGAAGLRHAIGMPDDTPLVGFVGRLSPEKGPEVFVRAAMLLKNRRPDARCLMFGEGPMHGRLQALIDEYDLSAHVYMAGARDDMPAVFNELDVVVSSSYTEAMPLSVMEAMASGLPVVATRVGGVPDIVQHGHTGWLVERNDFEDLATRTAELLGNLELRRQMGERARQRAIGRLDLNDSVDRVARLLSRLGQPGAREAQQAEVQPPLAAGPAVAADATPGPASSIRANGAASAHAVDARSVAARSNEANGSTNTAAGNGLSNGAHANHSANGAGKRQSRAGAGGKGA